MYIQARIAVQIAKWGNSLAVRLPASLIQKLDLKAGDEVEVLPQKSKSGSVQLQIALKRSREQVIDDLRAFAGRLPTDFKFDRDEANRR